MTLPNNQVFQFESPDDSPGFLLWQVSNFWQRKMNNGLSHLGLTHVQFVLLAGIIWLSQGEETVTQARLAAHAKTDIMMTSKVLRALEQRCLIKRETDAKDTRAKALSITNKGYELTIEAIKIVNKIDHDFFSALGQQAGDFNQHLQSIIDGTKPCEMAGWSDKQNNL
ncbi:MarR family winged helix-turn-helix transcriptional regulator [Cylindrospermum sp. FACHB-282]|uniref:MarR family winged helix-turn-helix transcriptional regulator n=1 Tax=Cylindrospermum sp. FACHB-282 TaxID=2692794 RepID=UPI001683BB9D|nr:MarR family winged helix-turn-helix transcriptional regulator [Cylindrospermum sp. FACHB-282]MBD2386822.1 winged helix-turn-helix transcriptional regulator [Cylindrospermum sp. FACHB-282]